MSAVEHVNINVQSLDRAIHFLQTAMPDFQVRHREPAGSRPAWAHVGTHESYLALNEQIALPMEHGSMNHMGFVVDDIETVTAKLRAAGYQPGYGDGEVFRHPSRLRSYWLDADGNEYEFVQYLTDDAVARNSYVD